MGHPLISLRLLAVSIITISTAALSLFAQPYSMSYGPPVGNPSGQIPRRSAMASASQQWKNAPFYYIQTELSPATLYHSRGSALTLFAAMPQTGLGAPACAAYASGTGVRALANGQSADRPEMSECWILVWFAGAKGWDNWDSPWAIYLQNKPTSLKLDESGLALHFDGPAGDMVMLPLYGYYKPPQEGKPSMAGAIPQYNLQTWTWSKALPADVLSRVRYWAKVCREYPVYCQDDFSVDRSRDTVTIRQRFTWRSIDDQWNTPHLKLAPISPSLALAAQDGKFPVKFSAKVSDPEMFTQYGPYMGVEGADQYDAEFKVLQYVNETEASDPPGLDAHPSVKAAWDRLQATAKGKFRRADKYEYDHGGMGNFCWAIMGDLWYAKALPYYDEQTRQTALASLKKYFHDDVLVPARFKEREYPKGSGQTYLILEGPGIGSWGVLGDAGKFSTNLLETLWAYAHHTGDWDLIRERWPLVRKLFCTAAETRWVTFGRDAIAEMGDEAAPCLAYARMAYKVGDIDTYNYACYMFARELVHHYIKQRGASYFRLRQPWHSMERMDEEVYLTNFWGDVASWQIDGPRYPAKTGERQYTNRWVRFKNEDVGRFYRDYLKDDVKAELDLLMQRWEPKRRYNNDSHIMPSMVQIRSLLLNETPEQLARVAEPGRFGGPASGVIGSCMAVLRTSHPTRYIRLIPPGDASPFVAGLEREIAGPNTYLAQAVQSSIQQKNGRQTTSRPTWPCIAWWGWKTPKGDRWNFGQIIPAGATQTPKAEQVKLNWNTEVLVYPLPE